MSANKVSKKSVNKKKLFGVGLCFALIISPLAFLANHHESNMVQVEAADYTPGTGGYSRGSDGSITANFVVSKSGLDMRGWLLILYSSKPATESSGKLSNSNYLHPYSASGVSHYFFASYTGSGDGNMSITWKANAADQRQSWSASESTGASGKTLKDYFDNGTNWHIVVGPRHYNTGWGDEGIGAGTNGYWENCDYYIGEKDSVFPTGDKTMKVTVTANNVTYDGQEHYVDVKPTDPSSGYTIKYRTASSGSYNLTSVPKYTNAGTYTTYFQVTKTGYTTYEGSGSFTIAKANPTYTAPTAKTGLVYNGSSQELIEKGSSNVTYSLDGSSYSSNVPSKEDAGTYTVYYKVAETTNYKGVSAKSFNVTIAKADPVYTAPSAISGLVYDGNEQTLVTSGSPNVTYSMNGTSYSAILPKATDAGTYTVYYRVDETTNYKSLSAQSFTVTIAKADPVYTAPTAISDLVYDGNEQALVTSGSSNVTYSMNGTSYSTTLPKATDAGTYTVYYRVDETTNYKALSAQSFTVTIAKANPIYTAPSAITGLIYNKESQNLVTAGSSSVLYSLDDVNYSSSVPTGIDAGDYTVYYKIEETDNYKPFGPETIEVSIAKANAQYIDTPTGKTGLNYTGENQKLISKGTSTGGTVLYSLDGVNYSTDIPEKKFVGTYTIYYKIEGDSNYIGVDATSIEVSIYENDKTALNATIAQAGGYSEEISSKYPNIANDLNDEISSATAVSEDVNQTEEEIANANEALIQAYDLAHAEVVDTLIRNIGDVRLTDTCLNAIITAEEAYEALENANQEALVTKLADLLAARDLYEKLKAVGEVISSIGEITYDDKCYDRILAAKEAFESLSKDEQNLIPTLFNELNKALDIYDMLKIIANLGEVEYTEEFKEILDNARNAFDALDIYEQTSVYNYQKLLDAEAAYNKVDNVVKLVDQIADILEYVGPHNPEIDKARAAYEALSEEEKALVPEAVVASLYQAVEEYEDIKVEHERKEIEDREAGVVIAIDGSSGIPETVSIDINNSANGEKDFTDNIDYQTISGGINENQTIETICEIKFYDEVDGEMVEIDLDDIDDNLTMTVQIEVPDGIDENAFKIILLDNDNNMSEVAYSYDPNTRIATIRSNRVGTFAIVTTNPVPAPAKDGIIWSILLAIIVTTAICVRGYFSIRNKKENG